MSKEKKTAKAALKRSSERKKQLMAALGLEWVGPVLKILKIFLLFVLFVVVPAVGILLLALQCRRGSDWSYLKKFRYAHRGLHRKGLPE